MTNGVLFRRQRSMARVIFSPTTAPMLPPMNFNSMSADLSFAPVQQTARADNSAPANL